MSGSLVILYLAFMMRIVLGPFPYSGVVAYHYLVRATTVSIITMLTYSRVLKTFFIFDFNKMSLIPEQETIRSFYLVTFLCTLVYLLQECAVRNIRGLPHYARWSISMYFGKVGFE